MRFTRAPEVAAGRRRAGVSGLVTGDAYVAALSADASDRSTRTAFVHLALALTRPRARIFDFGCGPGQDARFYADCDREVYAHDVDPDMCASFRRHCASGLALGSIRLVEHGSAVPPIDLVTANFAPLNLVPDLAPLFGKFAAMLSHDGQLLLSVLNPLHAGDLRYAWWWKGLLPLWLDGCYRVSGSQAPITRWRPSRLARQAELHFSLDHVYVPLALRAQRLRSPRHWPAAWSARFLFLHMSKLPAPP